MIIIGISLNDYASGFYGAAILAEEYVNMPEKAPQDMPNGRYGLEEYFELRIITAKICGTSVKEAFKDRAVHMRGMWDGFVCFVQTFRQFKVKTLAELEVKMMEHIKQQSKEQEQQMNDLHDADWWKEGGKKPWEKEQ